MQIRDLTAVKTDHTYKWPSGHEEIYPLCVEYRTLGPDGEHRVMIGFGVREVYSLLRRRAVVWVDDHPHAEFLGADDFEATGDVLSEIRVPGTKGERICRYPDEPVPERYAGLTIVGLSTRVGGPGVHGAWAVVANLADHRTLITLGALRRLERASRRAQDA